jgi:hypothetical protein
MNKVRFRLPGWATSVATAFGNAHCLMGAVHHANQFAENISNSPDVFPTPGRGQAEKGFVGTRIPGGSDEVFSQAVAQ